MGPALNKMSDKLSLGLACLLTATVSIPFVKKAAMHPAVNDDISSLCQ